MQCILLVAGLLLTACAGNRFSRIESSDHLVLPQEIATQIQNKFVIEEPVVSQPPPPVREAAQAHKEQDAKRQKKKLPPVVVPETSKDEIKTAPPVNRRPAQIPFHVGEKLTYEITYFGLGGGELTMEVGPLKRVNGRRVYHLQGFARSSKIFGSFYRVNDMIESYFDYESLYSHRFHTVLDESKQTLDGLELNDYDKSQTYYWRRWNHWKKGFTEVKELTAIPSYSQDSLSSIFYFRTLPFPEVGKSVVFPVVSEGRFWDAVVTVLRHEEIENDALGGLVKTVVVQPETKYQGVFRKEGNVYAWFSDDEHRYLVKLQAKIKIGSVYVRLIHVTPGNPNAE